MCVHEKHEDVTRDDIDQELMNNGNARLVAGDGSEIPLFFVPLAPPPLFPAGEESTVTLRFWQTVAGEAARSPITVEIDGESLHLSWQAGRYEPLNRSEGVK